MKVLHGCRQLVPGGVGLSAITSATLIFRDVYKRQLEDGSKALIINDKSQFNMQRKNYLYPIPLSQIQLNPALLQNPGY